MDEPGAGRTQPHPNTGHSAGDDDGDTPVLAAAAQMLVIGTGLLIPDRGPRWPPACRNTRFRQFREASGSRRLHRPVVVGVAFQGGPCRVSTASRARSNQSSVAAVGRWAVWVMRQVPLPIRQPELNSRFEALHLGTAICSALEPGPGSRVSSQRMAPKTELGADKQSPRWGLWGIAVYHFSSEGCEGVEFRRLALPRAWLPTSFIAM